MDARPDLRSRIRGLMLGTAVGDAMGLPSEGISPERIEKLSRGLWEHRFIAGRGMVSDDTDHTVFVAQSLIESPVDAHAFGERLAARLRWWLLSLPAGAGLATLKAILRLWTGMAAADSGVPSAGNGPAMRVAPIGALFNREERLLDAYVRVSTRLTHTDPRAYTGACAVARAVAWMLREQPSARCGHEEFAALLREAGKDDAEWNALVDRMEKSLFRGLPVKEFADSLGLEHGITGYIYHTVPVALYAWYRNYGDFAGTLKSVLALGGDTDTTGAIAGALAGAACGEEGIPGQWVEGICDYPHSTRYLRELADAMHRLLANRPPGVRTTTAWPLRLGRNLVFLCIVLAHGLRRLLPPY